MRKLLYPVAILLVAGALYVVLSDTGPRAQEGPLATAPEPATEAAPAPAPLQAKGGEGLQVRTGPRPRPPEPAVRDPRTLPKGSLLVRPVGPDHEPLGDRSLRVYVTVKGDPRTRLPGPYDEERQAWRFPDVTAGPARVRLEGDHVVGREQDVVVAASRETAVDVVLEPAGALRYDVVTYAKTRPKQVRLEVTDARGKPVRAWFQERTPRRLTQARRAEHVTQGPQGVVFGLPPGRYKLKATSIASDEWDEEEVVAQAGQTAEVTLEIRR